MILQRIYMLIIMIALFLSGIEKVSAMEKNPRKRSPESSDAKYQRKPAQATAESNVTDKEEADQCAAFDYLKSQLNFSWVGLPETTIRSLGGMAKPKSTADVQKACAAAGLGRI